MKLLRLYTLISYYDLHFPTTRVYTYPFFQFTFTNFSYCYIVSNKAFHREPSERDSNARKDIHDSSFVGSRCIRITTRPSMPTIPCNFMSTRSSKSIKQLDGRACSMRVKRNGPTLLCRWLDYSRITKVRSSQVKQERSFLGNRRKDKGVLICQGNASC